MADKLISKMAAECDFDELAALLEEDSDDEFGNENVTVKEEKKEDCKEPPVKNDITHSANEAESSDDDIDDDELDRLAGLIEEDEAAASSSLEEKTVDNVAGNVVKVKTEPKDQVRSNVEGRVVVKSDEELTETNELLQDEPDEEDTPEKESPEDEEEKGEDEEEEEAEEEEEDDNEDVEDKISQMYAMIQALQSQVAEKKSKKKKTPSKKQSVKSESDAKTVKQEAKPDAGNSTKSSNKPSKVAKQTDGDKKGEKKSLDAKLKLLEDDIFSKSTQDPKPSGSKSSDSKSGDKSEKPVKEEPVKTERLYTVKEAQQQIFGSDSDDSDWEGLDGERPSQLSKSGLEIKQIIKKEEKKRVAHAASYEVKQQIFNRPPMWGKKDVYKPRTGEDGASSSYTRSVSPPRSAPLPKKVEEDDKNILRDTFSELRIVNPRISSTQLKMRMEGRHMFQMSTIHRRINTADMEKDWVTIGVLVQKSEPKMSSKGKQYSIWTLSDLKDCQRVVKVFLFGDVHTQHWKTSIGSVLGFLNPNTMSNNERYQSKSDDVSLAVDNASKIMMMGQSKDFGYCKSFTKAGKKCFNFVNKYKAEFCEYHVSQAYKTASSKRGDLQGCTAGPVPKKHVPSLKQKVLGGPGESVFYAGQSFSGDTKKSNKKTVSLGSLATHEKTKGPLKKGHVTTLNLFELRPEDAEKLEKFEEKKKIQDQKAFHDMLATPTVGSMNLVKHLMGNKDKEEKKQLSFQSVTAQDMFKSRGKMNSKPGYSAVGGQSRVQVGSPSPLPSTSKSFPKLSSPQLGKSLPKLNVPQLGRGFGSGQSIFLESPTKKKAPSGPSNAEIQRRKAIEKIKRKGGVLAEDPNAVKKKMDDRKQEKIKKRLCEDSDAENEKNADNVQPKKKQRIVGGVNLDDPEIQKLMKKKSKHDNLLLEVEQEKQDEYFDALEKKEKMETKMSEVTKLKVKVVSCKKCAYMSQKPSALCLEEKHHLTWHEGTRSFFECQHCKYRAQSFDRLPKVNCNCGKNAWHRTSMFKEKKGPKLESEELVLRGEELKYLNSLQ